MKKSYRDNRRPDDYAAPAEYYQRDNQRILRQERLRHRVRWGLLLLAVACTAGAVCLMSGRP